MDNYEKWKWIIIVAWDNYEKPSSYLVSYNLSPTSKLLGNLLASHCAVYKVLVKSTKHSLFSQLSLSLTFYLRATEWFVFLLVIPIIFQFYWRIIPNMHHIWQKLCVTWHIWEQRFKVIYDYLDLHLVGWIQQTVLPIYVNVFLRGLIHIFICRIW